MKRSWHSTSLAINSTIGENLSYLSSCMSRASLLALTLGKGESTSMVGEILPTTKLPQSLEASNRSLLNQGINRRCDIKS